MTEVRDQAGRRADDSVLGPYRLVQPLGEGGMGVVHLGLDGHGRAVAVKVLRPYIAHDPMARERLRREVATLERIQHPGVAGVIDADIDGERPYLVTQYVPGAPLDEVVKSGGPLAGDELAQVARGLAEALEAIHECGVVHRDVKPGNVLLVDGEPVLIDFGIAHIADDVRLTSTGLVMGTPGYLSPEIVDGAEVSEATDWWGWAATVAYAALGHPPFGTGPMDVVLSRVSRGQFDLVGMDPNLAPLIAAALDPDPARRPSTDEVLLGVEAYANGRPVTEVIPLSGGSGGGLVGSGPAGLGPVPATERLPQGATRVLPQTGEASSEAGRGPESWPTGPPGTAVAHRAEGAPGTHTDPRIGRAKRTGVLAVLTVALGLAGALAPALTCAVVVLLMLLARLADQSVTSLVLRRFRDGVRRRDIPISVVSGPWHLVVAVIATVVGLLLPVVVFGAVLFAVALMLKTWTALPSSPLDPIPVGVATVCALWVSWWGPGSAGLRRGSRSLARGLARSDAAAQVVVAVLLLLAVGCVAGLLWRSGAAMWWPLTRPPSLFGVEPTKFRG